MCQNQPNFEEETKSFSKLHMEVCNICKGRRIKIVCQQDYGEKYLKSVGVCKCGLLKN